MKSKIISILISAAAIIIVLFLFVLQEEPPSDTPEARMDSDNSNMKKLETKTDDQKSVVVAVTPTDLSPQSQEWKFKITMDTHSVELNQDLTRIAAFVDEQGKKYSPIRWEGAPEGGHHREGVLVFKAISPMPSFIELQLSGVGGATRNFSWQL